MKQVSIGGQAVLEGVMMKNDDKYAIAIRKPDNEIEVKISEFKPAGSRFALFKVPIIRGVVNFIESLVIGVKTLTYSAEFLEEDEKPEAEKKKKKDIEEEKADTKKAGKENADKDSSDNLWMFGTVAVSIVLAVGLFMLLPAFLASLLDKFIKNHFALGLIEGIIRLIIFMIYVVLISRMKEIKRTYMYHGAEHKCINCLEHGDALTVENVMKHTRFHKRCGTSFLFIVMIVSILVFMCIDTDTLALRLLYRVLLVPLIAGISYEFIRFAGRSESLVANLLSKPGLWVQRLTTKEPEADMVEVAIKSVEGVLDWRNYLAELNSQDQ
ncbi:MAG: DUF1385 domain-containing protein [Clostridium sp.]|nr:DUF1385 domain-containing protein [Clostridium sp.]MCM1170549.1 DUF1385 domain-containing protein [Clostridium sp.]MCM1208001.1 DUF1385 domain-containing protein [Ruminococcus sp.]